MVKRGCNQITYIIQTADQSDSSACEPTFRLLVVTMTSPVRLVVRPCADGKLRRGGGGGGDLEGFSVRYLATLRSTENREGWVRTTSAGFKGQQDRSTHPTPGGKRPPPYCSASGRPVALCPAAGPRQMWRQRWHCCWWLQVQCSQLRRKW